jgi:ABC-2 type transport system ATP-binding protein
MLEVLHLSKSFSGTRAVQDVSFQALPGAVTGYLGPNGAGKSTTVRILAGLLEPDGGEVRLDGIAALDDPVEYKRRIGYVPEQAEIYLHLTPEEYLEFVGRLRLMPERLIHQKVEGFLEVFGLQSSRFKPLSAFSKGMRQKILIAGALIHDPRLLLMDEPLSGLDVRSVILMRELMPKLAEAGRILLFSTHVLEIAQKICDRVVILDKGRVVAHGDLRELLEGGGHDTLELLFRDAVALEDPSVSAARLAEVVALR